jgi:hypothetical protein
MTDTVYTGTVLRVVDGDTFVLQTTEGSLKIRLDGIEKVLLFFIHGTFVINARRLIL